MACIYVVLSSQLGPLKSYKKIQIYKVYTRVWMCVNSWIQSATCSSEARTTHTLMVQHRELNVLLKVTCRLQELESKSFTSSTTPTPEWQLPRQELHKGKQQMLADEDVDEVQQNSSDNFFLMKSSQDVLVSFILFLSRLTFDKSFFC